MAIATPCTTDPERFFTESRELNAQAKQECLTCPIRLECLLLALETHEQWGVWGGLTAAERRSLRPAQVRRLAVEQNAAA